MIETTTIVRDLVTPEVNQQLQAEAQAILDANPDAEKIFKDLVKDIQNQPDFTGDAYALAQQSYPAEFDAYALAAYCTKTINLLNTLPDVNAMPKITIPHDIVTDEIMAGLTAELIAKEAEAKKPGRTLHQYHKQSRERLDKLDTSRKAKNER